MATVTSFEALEHPNRSDLRRFAELFRPLYENSSEEARRQAVAALSRCPVLPDSVCFFIGMQPINVAALFLTGSRAVDDTTLINIARSAGREHARAIARREDLSPMVIDALAALHDGSGYRMKEVVEKPHHQEETVKPEIETSVEAAGMLEKARLAREEALRNELRHLVSLNDPERPAPKILRGINSEHEALLVRFARIRQATLFGRVLGDAMGASQALAERIMLDVSGNQLATTLIALGMNVSEIRFILCAFYPHLSEAQENRTRAYQMVRGLDPVNCVERLSAWRRADHYTTLGEAVEEDDLPEAANQDSAGAAAMLKPAGNYKPVKATRRLFGRR